MQDLKGKNVSLVLGSGGARGLAHIGVIKVLEERGAIINEVVGSSIGSLIGGFYAKGELQIFEDWVKKLTRTDVIRLLDFTLQSSGWVKGNKVLNKVKGIIPDVNIEELPIRFTAVSTNLSQGCEKAITKGSLYDAIRASIAVPGVITAFNQNQEKWIDGGVMNPLPLNHVKNKNSIIIAVNLEGQALKTNTVNEISTLSVLQQSYYLMRNQIIKLSVETYRPDYVVEIPRNISGLWDFSKAGFLIDKGRELGSAVIK